MIFQTEREFEEAVIKALKEKGWEEEVLRNPTEEQLLDNWARILFENNRGIDRLNDYPLTKSEMFQIREQVLTLRTPLKLNGFINGRTVSIIRDNPDDVEHLGKEISLKIYDRHEIAAGQSRYQIVQQPRYRHQNEMLNNRKGDLMLLINGMPVFHIELKKHGVPVSQAAYQIEKYAREGLFTGIFSLIQIFVAMEPNETLYFANPGPDGVFNKNYYFHWADYNNEPINYWNEVIAHLLSIPMAHQLIGFYTIADESDGVLKVLRSYQYYAASAISDKVAKMDWTQKNLLGGYVWHTTGSGKTMTSFKSAQLIANSKDADKVVFLMDRIELGTQSLREYRGFAEDNEDVQATENTYVLISKLKSDDPADTLIVTSIQKMSNIKDEDEGLKSADINLMNRKRVVFIVDEAHRSTFGDMLITIKKTFPRAVFFGFTGTPIQKENQKKLSTTATIFGDELHRYSIADGIRDGNVLGFDPYKVMTYRDIDLRKNVALKVVHASSEAEALGDPNKNVVYKGFLDAKKVPMASTLDKHGNIIKGIEDYIPTEQYERLQHQEAVVDDISENWLQLSNNGMFHAIFATSSIREAIEYYRIFKQKRSDLKVTALFHPSIDNAEGVEFKSEGLEEIMRDYNGRYEQDFYFGSHGSFKRDIAARLAHKKPYERIERSPEKQIDILIVVDQMLTGFDSKWVNTLYLDKVLKYENVIQAFSRTNRLFGPEKPFGTIRYYRYPYTMQKNIHEAVAMYSGNKALGLFVQQLDENLNMMNETFDEIVELFINANEPEFFRLPADPTEVGRFAKLFNIFNLYLEASRVQGFSWEKLKYKFDKKIIEVRCTHNIYLILVQRYKEIEFTINENQEIAFDIDTNVMAIDTDRIDIDYMNSRFEKYLKELRGEHVNEEQLLLTLNELHKSFATMTQEEQKYANIFLHDVQRGEAEIVDEMSFRDYVTAYLSRGKNEQVMKLANTFDLDLLMLDKFMNLSVNNANINEYGRFDKLKASVNREQAKAYFERIENKSVSMLAVSMKIDHLLKEFIISGGFDIDEYVEDI